MAGDTSHVEPLSQTPAQIHDSGRSPNDSEAPPKWSSSISSKASKLKAPDKPGGKPCALVEKRQVVEKWYQENKNNPYPSQKEVEELMSQSNLTKIQIRNFLCRARRRDRDAAKFSTSRGLSGLPQEKSSQSLATETESGHGTGFAETQSVFEHLRTQGERQMFAPQRQGENIFQCRYCNRGFRVSHSWIRHEVGCGPAQGGYMCMKDELKRTDDMGNPACPFCGIANSSDQHLIDDHNYLVCLRKPAEKRNHKRLGSLKDHFKSVHKATKSLPASWCVPPDAFQEASQQPRWCGFCAQYQGTRKECNTHIGRHFKDTKQVFDMTRWIQEPNRPESEPAFSTDSQTPELPDGTFEPL